MHRSFCVAAVASVIAAVLWATASASRSAPGLSAETAHGISWGSCSDPLLQQSDAKCGYLSVPLGYSNPGGQQIQLAVSRIEHASDHDPGVLVANRGGPGGSGLDVNVFLVSALQQEGFPAAAGDYAWIGFDPRGVGSSEPAISCIPNYFRPDGRGTNWGPGFLRYRRRGAPTSCNACTAAASKQDESSHARESVGQR